MTVVALMCVELIMERLIDDYMKKKHKGEEDTTTTGYVPPASRAETSQESTTEHPQAEEQAEEEQEEETGKKSGVEVEHTHTHIHPVEQGDNPFSAVILTLALSIHSIVEGLGLGATSDISEIQSAFVAIAVHKGFTAFALAQGMITSGYWRKGLSHKAFYLSLGTFIFVGLLGIAIGWGISSVGEGESVAILIGITSGSFIYVAMLELLPEEMATVKRERLPLLPVILTFLTGYMLMTMLAIWV